MANTPGITAFAMALLAVVGIKLVSTFLAALSVPRPPKGKSTRRAATRYKMRQPKMANAETTRAHRYEPTIFKTRCLCTQGIINSILELIWVILYRADLSFRYLRTFPASDCVVPLFTPLPILLYSLNTKRPLPFLCLSFVHIDVTQQTNIWTFYDIIFELKIT